MNIAIGVGVRFATERIPWWGWVQLSIPVVMLCVLAIAVVVDKITERIK